MDCKQDAIVTRVTRMIMKGTFVVLLLLLNAPSMSARLAGFHVDDESCSGLIQDNITKQRLNCAAYLSSLVSLKATLAKATKDHSLPKSLVVSVDTGTGWLCQQGATNCINITFQGQTKSVAEHVMDLADEVNLMDYTRDPIDAWTRAKPFLEYADSDTAVSIGLAISSPQDKTPDSWYTRSESELAMLMATLQQKAQQYQSFKRFSTFIGGNWRNQSSVNPAPANTTFERSSVWYADHCMLVDPAKHVQYLTWVKSRNIHALYTAPQAGGGPCQLIGGSNDEAFCNFARAADAQGLDITLYGSTDMNLPFIVNCSLRDAT